MGRMLSMECGSKALMHLSLVFGLLAAGTLFLAISTDFWLYTSELIDPNQVPNDDPNKPSFPNDVFESDTENSTSMEFFDMSKNVQEIKVHSGLWRSCIYFEEDESLEEGMRPICSNIVYFGQDTDRTETTHSINRAIRKASPVLVSSLLVMATALALSILGSNKRDVRTLMAAILYICSALSLAVGVIFYISSVNDEVSHRRKSITGERDGFKYFYGWAFFFTGIAFICSMVAAVNNISLYLLRFPAPSRSIVHASVKPEVLLPPERKCNITTPV